MISMMIYDPQHGERELIQKTVRQVAARLTDEKWQMDYFAELTELENHLQESPLLDLACYDVAPKGSIDFLEEMRRRYQESLLLIIADSTMSPMDYIRPTILVSSLLIRPITVKQLTERLSELVERYQEQNRKGQEESLVIETREGKTYVPFSKIYYFEAREKRIYVRLKRQELTFYDTMDHLLERLPEQFVRCHRSFIVNRNRITKVMLSKNLMELEQEMEIPLSRSYKSVFKEMS